MRIKLNVPEDLSEITLAQYQRWIKIAEKQEEVNTFYQQKMIEIFCNIPLNNVLMIRANDIDKITQNINTLFEKEPKFIDRFVKKGIKFGFIPNQLILRF